MMLRPRSKFLAASEYYISCVSPNSYSIKYTIILMCTFKPYFFTDKTPILSTILFVCKIFKKLFIRNYNIYLRKIHVMQTIQEE